MIDVVVVGAGPTGVWLASELHLLGVDTLVIEQDAQPSPVVRGLGLHARTVEIMDQRGIADRFLAAGTQYPLDGYVAGIPHPAPSDLDSPFPFVLGIPQPVTERLLLEHAAERGVQIQRGARLVGLAQDPEGVDVTLADGGVLRARFLVGADGGRSSVRKLAGIAFPGEAAGQEWLIGEVELSAPAEEVAAVMARVRTTQRGFAAVPTEEGGYRVVVPARGVSEDRERPTTVTELIEAVLAVAGTDLGIGSARWLSRFGDATRLADRYRAGRVLLAGDAAHVHPPLGGQGLNLGIHDAFNLGWKLAAEVHGTAPAGLLDSYHAERHPVAADVLTTTRALGQLITDEPGPRAVRALVAELLDVPGVHRYLVEKIMQTAVRYGLGDGHELIGRRMPDVPVGDSRVFALLRSGRGVLLDSTGRLSAEGWEGRVDAVVDERAALVAPAALVRPDGHVAWAGEGQAGLEEALGRWFGSPGGSGGARSTVGA